MPQYWLISVPVNAGNSSTGQAEQDRVQSWHQLRRSIAEEPTEYAETCALKFPSFKTGSLDGLMTLSDELVKYDQALEATANKLADTLGNLLGEERKHLSLHLTVYDKSVDHYVKTFQWNTTKYRPDRPLKDIVVMIAESVGNVDSALKTKITQFNNVKGSVQNLERKQTGNLAVRSLVGIVKQEDCITDSEYLQTVFVAVPRNLSKEWQAKYEKLVFGVVPRSSVLIQEDAEYGLYSVVLLQKSVAEFTNKCREEKFITREFQFDESQLQRDRQELAELEATKRALNASLFEWCNINFGEVFASWIHVKFIRTYVESVLRYGLSSDYMAGVIKPHPNHIDKVEKTLDRLYGYLEGKHRQKADATSDDLEEMQHLSLYDKNYRPYVCYAIDWHAAESNGNY
ncbi:hypothetical protein BDF19DRAFT_434330 [Syncephalis fuscata]|nr:hypothetical protein BDF19DRAFT_434330 [Syncephalis fuscata]